MRALSRCNTSRVSDAKTGASASAIAGCLEHDGADHRRQGMNDLGMLVVAQRDQVERGQFAVGAVGHRRVDPGNALGRGA